MYFDFTFELWRQALASGIPTVISLGIIVYVALRFPRNLLTFTFLLFVFSLFIWQADNTLSRISVTAQMAAFWGQMLAIGSILMIPAGIHFALIFGGYKKIANSPIVIALLYIPVLIARGRSGQAAFDPEVLQWTSWGWAVLQESYSLGDIIQTSWVGISAILMFGIFVFIALKSSEKEKRIQALIISAGLLVPVFQGVVTEIVFPILWKINSIPITTTTLSLFSYSILFALKRTRLFAYDESAFVEGIVKGSSEVIVVVDRNGYVKFANEKAQEKFGIPKENNSNFSIRNVVSQDENGWDAFCKSLISPVLRGEEPADMQQKIFDSQGAVSNYVFSASDVSLENKKGKSILLVGYDITNRLEFEKELRKNSEDLAERNASLEDLKKAIINIMEDEREVAEELRIEKEGVEKKIEDRTSELKNKTVELEKAKNDINQALVQVNEERAKLLASINSLPSGFIVTDRNGEIIIANNHISHIFDCPDKDWKIKDIQNYFGKEFEFIDIVEKAIASKKTQEIKELLYKSKYLHIFMSPVVITSGKKESVAGAIILIEDITEAKVLERSKDEFFSIASHELRTPLTSIRGNTSLIKQYYSEKLKDKELVEMIQDIHDSSTRLIEIVNDFLDISRIEQGRIEYKFSTFDIGEIIKSVVDEIESATTNKEVKFTITNNLKSKANVLADPDRTKQIIYNLVGNSVKFTEKGEVTVLVNQKDKVFEIRVRDTGKGIPDKSKALLFRKFQQASNNLFTRDTTRGTGLGLYISKMLAQGMKGDIVLESTEENKGSTFMLTLPAGK